MNTLKLTTITSLLLFPLILFVSGCLATTAYVRGNNRENINQLFIGMSMEQVRQLMGTESIMVDMGRGPYGYEKISSPYRTETLQGKDKVLVIWFYYTDLKRLDAAITDDELTPVVFDGDKVIGWGLGFLDSAVQKYEIRVR